MEEVTQLKSNQGHERTTMTVRTGLRAGSLEVNCIVEAFDSCMALHDDSPLCSYAAMENCYISKQS